MDSEYTRQTRWADLPDIVSPEQIPAGTLYVRQAIWVACNQCDLQIHSAWSHALVAGITCPECGARLAAPVVREDPEAAAARVRDEEQELRGQMLSSSGGW